MKIIGITGGVGAGKSCIIDFLSNNYRCVVALADDIAKSLYTKGNPCFDKIIDLLGVCVLCEDGALDKKKMASMIYNNESLLTAVNDIVHPAVKEEILMQISDANNAKCYDFFFLEAALLIETGYKDILDELWYVYASQDIRRERLKSTRGYSDDKIDSIFASQLSDEVFRSNSDFVIDNSFLPEDSYRQIRERMKKYERQE